MGEFLGKSTSTISIINTTNSFEEYREKMRRSRAKCGKKIKTENTDSEKVEQEAIEHRIKVETNYAMMQEMRKMNEQLTLISNKLAFIVDELTTTP